MILKSLTSTYIPSLLASCPKPLDEPDVQLSPKLFIKGEFFPCATASVEAAANAATPTISTTLVCVIAISSPTATWARLNSVCSPTSMVLIRQKSEISINPYESQACPLQCP